MKKRVIILVVVVIAMIAITGCTDADTKRIAGIEYNKAEYTELTKDCTPSAHLYNLGLDTTEEYVEMAFSGKLDKYFELQDKELALLSQSFTKGITEEQLEEIDQQLADLAIEVELECAKIKGGQ